ncbi:MAG: GNAT family N-acetyltransferase [Candidatus Promineifilaceae bacterium]|nr:GNAT family N-acetyltransferase [Candidatus Promineifilaceae bacterium]
MTTYTLRPAAAADESFAYRVKKEALGPYVEKTWGWDETWQRDYHRRNFNHLEVQIIEVEDEPVGTLMVERGPAAMLLHGIYILPHFQRRGVGSTVIADLLAEAQEARLPLRLQVLKVNPARRLYERLGFRVVGGTDHHFLMMKDFSETPA